MYDSALANALGSTSSGNAPNIDFLSDTIKATLHLVGYTPAKTTDDFVNDLTNEHANGGGYTTGGETLASKTLAVTSSVVIADAADVVWTSATITAARSVVISDRTPGTAATQPLICYNKSDADITSTGGNFTWVIAATGIFRLTVSAEA